MSDCVHPEASALGGTRGSLALLLAALIPLGCSGLNQVLSFNEQLEQVARSSRIDGNVSTERPTEGTLVILLARAGDGGDDPWVPLDTYVRRRPGSFLFSVDPGRYLLGAYEDRNRNGLLDKDERVLSSTGNTPLEVGPGETVSQDLVIPRDAVLSELTEAVDLFDLVARTPAEQRRFSLWAYSAQGRVCEDLDAEEYGPSSGQRGLWRIVDFVNDELAGIYFMDPYDSRKIPVLFVHGVAGYPQEFSTLMEGIDGEHFQPWFYFYPSGYHIDDIADHLATLLERVQIKHGFDDLAIVTHSMGGLVSRGAVLKYYDETDQNEVKLLISISAPWGGDQRGAAAESAPIELPESFKDLSPKSEYLHWLFYHDEPSKPPRTLPEDVAYHLLFSFHMMGRASVANDGSISVASQLRSEAQLRALSQRGYDLSHSDILHSEEVLGRINELLEERFR